MIQPRRNVTDAELEVLELLWDRGPSTIRQLADQLYPEGKTAHYATVQKRLDGRVNIYRAEVDRQDLIVDRLRETANRLCEGSLTPLLTQLVGRADLSRSEIAQLRELVEQLDHGEEGGGS